MEVGRSRLQVTASLHDHTVGTTSKHAESRPAKPIDQQETEIANMDTEVEGTTIDVLVQCIFQNFPCGSVGDLPLASVILLPGDI